MQNYSMGAVFEGKRDSPNSKKSEENPTPNGWITVLMFVAVALAIGGIFFHFFKKKKELANAGT